MNKPVSATKGKPSKGMETVTVGLFGLHLAVAQADISCKEACILLGACCIA